MTGIPVSAGELVGVDFLNEVSRAHVRKLSAKTVNTTVSPTDLLNNEVTLGAGWLSSSRHARLTAWGDWKQNSGGTVAAPRFQVLLGATTLIDTGAPVGWVANATTRYAWRITVELLNLGASNSQSAYFTLQIGWATGSSTVAAQVSTGEGTYATIGGTAAQGFGICNAWNTGAVDTSVAQAFILNVINPSNSALCETKLYGAVLEFM